MKRDRIRLMNMSFYGYHGVHSDERAMGKKFFMDVEMTVDLQPAGQADDLAQTVDYAQVYGLVKQIQESKQYNLLEGLAEDIAQRLLKEFPIEDVVVRVRKGEVPVGGLMDFVEVEIRRSREG